MSHQLRREIIDVARRTSMTCLTQGTSGNVSARVAGGFVVTPTGVPYEELQPRDLVLLDLEGHAEPGQRRPSSEWRIHRDIYAAREDVGAVVHAHPTFATTIACLRRDLPAVHYMIAMAGGADVRCAAYATFGTEELSRNVLAALEGRKACLLANHGIVTVGSDLARALRTAEEIERVAELYWRALSVGEAVLLDEDEMARVLARFGDYGQQPRRR
ncbi:MAG: class II aldolase/adducin family protein [Gemmatimonadales bacterium]